MIPRTCEEESAETSVSIQEIVRRKAFIIHFRFSKVMKEFGTFKAHREFHNFRDQKRPSDLERSDPTFPVFETL